MLDCNSINSPQPVGSGRGFAPASDRRWYCVHTKPQKEIQVASYYRHNLGIETYYPRLKQYRTIRRVRRVVCGPLFPRYLFCRFELQTAYRAVRYAPDVIDLVHLGRGPTVVDDSLIAQLKGWAGDTSEVIMLQPDLDVGDTVEITDGPLRGLPAVILRTTNDRDRVAILLTLLECNAQTVISRSQLRRVS